MLISATVYIRPHGETQSGIWEVSDELVDNYEAMCKAGAHLAVELLSTEQVSITIEDTQVGFDFDGVIVSLNKESTIRGFEKLIRRFSPAVFSRMRSFEMERE